MSLRLRVSVAVGAFCLTAGMALPAPAYQTAFTTYVASAGEDSIRDVVGDSAGNIYVVGGTGGAFPASLYPASLCHHDCSFGSSGSILHDAYLMKFSSAGALLWWTYLGGPEYDRAYAVELDGAGNVYVAGRAGVGFPTTSGVFQPSFAGDYEPNGLYGPQDGFVAKLTPQGTLLWATYFGAGDAGIIRDIAVDAAGIVTIGASYMTGAPTAKALVTPGSYQTVARGNRDGLVARLSANGTTLLYGTYVGGHGEEVGQPTIRVDAAGNFYSLFVTRSPTGVQVVNASQPNHAGIDDFLLTKFTPNGTVVYSTYYGGSGDESFETHNLGVNPQTGEAFIVATTDSVDLPGRTNTKAGGKDGFIARFSPTGAVLSALYVGGNGDDGLEGAVVDASGTLYTTGHTESTNLAVLAPVQASPGGSMDCLIAKFGPGLSKLFLSYFGGGGLDVCRSTAIYQTDIVFTAYSDGGFPIVGGRQSSYSGGAHDGAFGRLADSVQLSAPGKPQLVP